MSPREQLAVSGWLQHIAAALVLLAWGALLAHASWTGLGFAVTSVFTITASRWHRERAQDARRRGRR